MYTCIYIYINTHIHISIYRQRDAGLLCEKGALPLYHYYTMLYYTILYRIVLSCSVVCIIVL